MREREREKEKEKKRERRSPTHNAYEKDEEIKKKGDKDII